MLSIVESFVPSCLEAGVDFVAGVPDGYLAPLISAASASPALHYIAAAREEDCLGIASGLAMCNKKPIALMQNVGFMNAIGCFSTLCLTYRTPFVIIIANRGNLYDKTKYDVQKYRYFEKIANAMNVFTTSWRAFRDEPHLISLCYQRALTAAEPVLLLLDAPPD